MAVSDHRPYECMVILDADLEEETIRTQVESWLARLEERGAERGYVDFWGKRKFAYEIGHRKEGYYVVFQARAEPSTMDELHRSLSLTDEVIRHKVLRVPEEVYGPPAHLASRTGAPGGAAVGAPDGDAGPGEATGPGAAAADA